MKNKNNHPMKHELRKKNIKIFLISILYFITLQFYNCSKDIVTDEEQFLLYTLLSQNSGNSTTYSIVEINLRDFNSYEGKCLDTFLGISAGAYFNTQYPPESRNTSTQKVFESNENCSYWGFKGGVENRIDGRTVSFLSYSCGASTSLCNGKAIKEAGYD
jgi:hypothetical protein